MVIGVFCPCFVRGNDTGRCVLAASVVRPPPTRVAAGAIGNSMHAPGDTVGRLSRCVLGGGRC